MPDRVQYRDMKTKDVQIGASYRTELEGKDQAVVVLSLEKTVHVWLAVVQTLDGRTWSVRPSKLRAV